MGRSEFRRREGFGPFSQPLCYKFFPPLIYIRKRGLVDGGARWKKQENA